MSKIKFTETELVGFIEEIAKSEISQKITKTKLTESKDIRLKIWTDRFERKNMDKSPEIIFENFITGIHKLQRNGITTDELSESLKKNKKYILEQKTFTMSQDQGVLGSLWGTVREKLWTWLLGTFGITGDLADFVAISLGNVPIWDIPKLLNCNYLAPFLTKGLIEYGAFKLGKATIGLDGTFEQVLRNSLTDIGDNSAIYIEIEGKVREVLCGPLDEKKKQVEDVLGDNKGKVKYGEKVKEPSKDTTDSGAQSKGAGGIMSDLLQKYVGKFAQNLGK